MNEGAILRNRYRLERSVGRGGMADVYLAFDLRRQVYVAVKVLREDLAEDPEFVRRFQREAEALARLDHPNVVRFYSFERQDRLAFIVMDYISGTTLRGRLLDVQGSLSLPEITNIIHSVCAALHYAHSLGYIHRDIKPGNIMIKEDGTVLLSDFGIARAAEATTMTQGPLGTPAYMSPEQVLGRDIDPRSDIYSLGIVLYEMCTGRRPFTGESHTGTGGTTTTADRVRYEQLHATPADPRQFNPNLPAAAVMVIYKSLAKEPSERWSDVVSFAQAWENAVGNARQTAAADLGAIRTAPPPAQGGYAGPGTVIRGSAGGTTPTQPMMQTPPTQQYTAPQTSWPPSGNIQSAGIGQQQWASQATNDGQQQQWASQAATGGTQPQWAAPVSAGAAVAKSHFSFLWLAIAAMSLLLVVAVGLLAYNWATKSGNGSLSEADMQATTLAQAQATAVAIAEEWATGTAQAMPTQEKAITPATDEKATLVAIAQATANANIEATKRAEKELSQAQNKATAEMQVKIEAMTAEAAAAQTTEAKNKAELAAKQTADVQAIAAKQTEEAKAQTDAAAKQTADAQGAAAQQTREAAARMTSQAQQKPTAAPQRQPGIIYDFETDQVWKRGDQPNGDFTRSNAQVHSGGFSGQLTYVFPASADNFVVFVAKPAIPVGNVNGLSAWVYGDGSDAFLNVWMLDNAGEVRQYTLGQINFTGWVQMRASLDNARGWPNVTISGPDNGVLDPPAKLYAIVLDGIHNESAAKGVIYIDDIGAF